MDNKPRILILTAAGKTGMPVALTLLEKGFPVTAFVHQEDQRSARLKAKGADVIVGSLTDIDDMRRAMHRVKRAYFCVPPAEGNLKAAAIFAIVAAEQALEAVVTMSQWLANPNHPARHTRETWLADRLIALLPATAVTTINVGFFADNDMQSLAFAAQFGLLMLAYGHGLNAPPSNEDIAAVIAEILARPDGHAGKAYRPTGPKLLSPQEMAAIFSKIYGYKIRYVNSPLWLFRKIMLGMGYSHYLVAQTIAYYRDYQLNAFGIDAPTDVVRRLTGREPEDFETIARRYAGTLADTRRSFRTQIRLMLQSTWWLLRPRQNTDDWLAQEEFSSPHHLSLSANSQPWRDSHGIPVMAAPIAPVSAAAGD